MQIALTVISVDGSSEALAQGRNAVCVHKKANSVAYGRHPCRALAILEVLPVGEQMSHGRGTSFRTARESSRTAGGGTTNRISIGN